MNTETRIKELAEQIANASVVAAENGEISYDIYKETLLDLLTKGIKITLSDLKVDESNREELEFFEDKDNLEAAAWDYLRDFGITNEEEMAWVEENFPKLRLKKYFHLETFEDGHDDWDGGGWITHWEREAYSSVTFYLEEV